nr:hypothetical protein [Tanacetum cinerariifolium]
MDYQSAHEKEQHLAQEPIRCKKDSYEVVIVVVALQKVYVHESLTFNDTDGMVFRCGPKVEIWVTKGLSDEAEVTQISALHPSHDYMVVCMRLDIAYANLGKLDKFDRGLPTNKQDFVDIDYIIGHDVGRSITSQTLGS